MSLSGGDETKGRFRTRAARIHRNRFLAPTALGALALAPVVLGVGAIAHLPFLLEMVAPLLLASGVAGSGLALAENPWTRDVEGELEAGRGGLFEGGRLLVPSEQMRAGFVVPDSKRGPRVRIARKMKLPVEIRVRDEAEGRELLRALGLDATQRATTFSTPSRAVSDPRWSIGIGVGFAAPFTLLTVFSHVVELNVLSLQLPILAAYLGLMFLTRTSITVGADGVLRSWLGKKEFWSYGDIEQVRTFVDLGSRRKQRWEGIELVLGSGTTVRIPISQARTLQQSNLELIPQQICEAMESYRQGDAAAETALLSRQARSVADWVQSLRAIGSGAHVDHRTAPVGPERLFRIVEDPSLTASARAGAAVALGASLDAGGKVRLKGVAGATAAPKLRIAIEAAASGDDAALIVAIEAIEGEAEKRAQM